MGSLGMNLPKALRAIALELRAFREKSRAAGAPPSTQEIAYANRFRQVHGIEPPEDGFGLIGCEGAFRLNESKTALRNEDECRHMVTMFSMALDIPSGPTRQELDDISSFTEGKIKTSAAAQERSWTVMVSQVEGVLIQVNNFMRANGFQTGEGNMAAIQEMFTVDDSSDGEGLRELLANVGGINLL